MTAVTFPASYASHQMVHALIIKERVHRRLTTHQPRGRKQGVVVDPENADRRKADDIGRI